MQQPVDSVTLRFWRAMCREGSAHAFACRASGTHQISIPCMLDHIEIPSRGAYCSGFSQLPQVLDVSGMVKVQSKPTGSSQSFHEGVPQVNRPSSTTAGGISAGPEAKMLQGPTPRYPWGVGGRGLTVRCRKENFKSLALPLLHVRLGVCFLVFGLYNLQSLCFCQGLPRRVEIILQLTT
jgi:hypothetical protein